MSSSLVQIAVQSTRCVLPVIIILGTIGNCLNIVILTRPVFRRKTCSFYLLAFSINNLFYSSVVLVYRLLLIGYQISPNLSSVALCKLLQYVNDVCPSISPYLLVLASFNRLCCSSDGVRLRRFNQITVARLTTALAIGWFLVYFINTPLLASLRFDDGLGCRIRSDSVYNQIYVIVQAVLMVMLAPFLMGLFGLMTVHQIRRVRIAPVVDGRRRRKEIQLARMVLYQVAAHMILTLPMTIAYLMLLLPTVYSKMPNFYGIYAISYLPFYLSYGTSFLVHVLSVRLYRAEFTRVFRQLLRFRVRN